jgi:hypothetical protein
MRSWKSVRPPKSRPAAAMVIWTVAENWQDEPEQGAPTLRTKSPGGNRLKTSHQRDSGKLDKSETGSEQLYYVFLIALLAESVVGWYYVADYQSQLDKQGLTAEITIKTITSIRMLNMPSWSV